MNNITKKHNLFKGIKTRDLLNSYVVLCAAKSDFIFNNSEKAFTVFRRVFGDRLFFFLLGNTIGRHFTVGSDLSKAKEVTKRLGESDVGVIMGYLAEFIEEKENECFFDINCQRYIDHFKIKSEETGVCFYNAVKISSMVKFVHLKRFNENQEKLEEMFMGNDKLQQNEKGYYLERSDLIESIQSGNNSLTKEDIDSFLNLIKLNEESDRVYYVEWRLNCGFTNIHNKAVQDHPIYRTLSPFNQEEQKALNSLLNRLFKIMDKAVETRTFILVDAEQSYLQLAIYNIVEQLMHIYNKDQSAFIFNTIQNYTVESTFLINYEINKSTFFKDKSHLMIKMVKGAYIDEEREIEALENSQIIWKNKQETDEAYHNNVVKLIEAETNNKRFVFATHNHNTFQRIHDHLYNTDKLYLKDRISFAGLYGFNDQMTLTTVQNKYNTLKYIPYGEYDITLPYLIRRGRESKELLKESDAGLKLIRQEVWDRLTRSV